MFEWKQGESKGIELPNHVIINNLKRKEEIQMSADTEIIIKHEGMLVIE